MQVQAFELSKKYSLKDSVSYADGSVVSKIIERNEAGNVTLFAFDKGQNLSEHSAPFNAMIQVVDGKGTIYINKEKFLLSAGEIIIMPANVPHAVEATEKFKMLLTMIKSK